VSARIGVIGVPGCWIRTLSLPLSPRAGLESAVSAAPVRYATECAEASVKALAMLAVAGVTASGSPDARARAIDHDQPTANKTRSRTENALNTRSARPALRLKPRGRVSGNASSQFPGVALRGGRVELERLSSILPLKSGLMQPITDFFHRFSNLPELVQWAGLIGLTIIVFSETGLLVGFFLPGDSLLVTAGLLSATGYLNVYELAPILTLAAISGNSLGYFIGHTTGPRIFTRENSLFFNKKHAIRAGEFYAKHGRKTIVLAQFMPIIRTFSPVIAGVGGMKFRTFLTFNVLGAILWVWSMLGIGYFLGNYIPGVDQHIEIVVIIVVFISLLPGLISGYRSRRARLAAERTQVERS
jgi:membrane-associated protein